MRRVLIVCVMLGVLTGCNGVILNAEYTRALDRTTMLSDLGADRAEASMNMAIPGEDGGLIFPAGTMTPAQMADALRWNANCWQAFKDAKDGVTSE